MSHDSRSRGVISFPLDCSFFFLLLPFRQSIMWTVFSEGHLQLPSSQHASLSCVCLPFSPPRPFHPLKHACMHPDTLTSWKRVGVVADLGGQAGEVRFAKWEVDNKVQRTKMPPSQPFSPRSTSAGRLGPARRKRVEVDTSCAWQDGLCSWLGNPRSPI